MLEAAGLTRRYGRRWALSGVDLRVEKSRRLAILGANGSGKTTLLKIFARLLRPTGGEVRFEGLPLDRLERGRLGLMGHVPYLYPALTVRENLDYFGRIYGLSRGGRGGRISFLAERLGLAGRLDEPVRALSQGLRQRAALARVMLHEPELLLLDEPFTGLDGEAAARLEEILREYFHAPAKGGGAAEKILLFTTHDPRRALSMAEEAVVLSDGRVAFREATEGLSAASLAEACRAADGISGPAGGA